MLCRWLVPTWVHRDYSSYGTCTYASQHGSLQQSPRSKVVCTVVFCALQTWSFHWTHETVEQIAITVWPCAAHAIHESELFRMRSGATNVHAPAKVSLPACL